MSDDGVYINEIKKEWRSDVIYVVSTRGINSSDFRESSHKIYYAGPIDKHWLILISPEFRIMDMGDQGFSSNGKSTFCVAGVVHSEEKARDKTYLIARGVGERLFQAYQKRYEDTFRGLGDPPSFNDRTSRSRESVLSVVPS